MCNEVANQLCKPPSGQVMISGYEIRVERNYIVATTTMNPTSSDSEQMLARAAACDARVGNIDDRHVGFGTERRVYGTLARPASVPNSGQLGRITAIQPR